MMDECTKNLMDECKRQEESCLHTSTAFFEWLKFLWILKTGFVVGPIVLGAIGTWKLLDDVPGWKWIGGMCTLLAVLVPAVYKALDYDVSLDAVKANATTFKNLQDRFRQAWRVTALGGFDEFKQQFDALMDRMDEARSSSLALPERFFEKPERKSKRGTTILRRMREKRQVARKRPRHFKPGHRIRSGMPVVT
jgi:hypothetical protein